MNRGRAVVLTLLALATVGGGVAAAKSVRVTRFLARSGEIPGFRIGAIHLEPSIAAWVSGEPPAPAAADKRRLKSDGFREGAFRRTSGKRGLEGTSSVAVFASASGARDYQRFDLHPPGSAHRFTVHGIPGARGYAQGSARTGGPANVVWTEGRCTLVVGDFNPSGLPPRRPLIAAARAIYRRTRHTCP